MALFLKILGWILVCASTVFAVLFVIFFMVGLSEVIRYEERYREEEDNGLF